MTVMCDNAGELDVNSVALWTTEKEHVEAIVSSSEVCCATPIHSNGTYAEKLQNSNFYNYIFVKSSSCIKISTVSDFSNALAHDSYSILKTWSHHGKLLGVETITKDGCVITQFISKSQKEGKSEDAENHESLDLVTMIQLKKRKAIGLFRYSWNDSISPKSSKQDFASISVDKVTKCLKIQSVYEIPFSHFICFIPLSLGSLNDHIVLLTLMENDNPGLFIYCLCARTLKLVSSAKVPLEGLQNIDIDKLYQKDCSHWKLVSVGKSRLKKEVRIILWSPFLKYDVNTYPIGVLTVHSESKDISFVSWFSLVSPSSSLLRGDELFVTSLDSVMCNSNEGDTTYMSNFIVLWSGGVYQCYTISDSRQLVGSSEIYCKLVNEYNVWPEHVDCGSEAKVIPLTSTIALEACWDRHKDVVTTSLRHLFLGTSFSVDEKTCSLYLNKKSTMQIPEFFLSHAVQKINGAVYLFCSIHKQIYVSMYGNLDWINFASFLSQSAMKQQHIPPQKVFSCLNVDTKEFSNIIKQFMSSSIDLSTDGKKLLQFISLGLFPHSFDELKQIIDMKFLDALEQVVQSSIITEEMIAQLFTLENFSALEAAIVINRHVVSNVQLVQACRKYLQMHHLSYWLNVIFDWLIIFFTLPQFLIIKVTQKLPSLDRLLDFLGVLIDAKFLSVIESNNKEFASSLESIGKLIAGSLKTKRQIQKIKGQIFAVTHLRPDAIRLQQNCLCETTVFNL